MNNNRARSFMQVRRGRSNSRSRSKRGVSPVIGVILMVAATIVIAGVVMAMLGKFGSPPAPKTVGLSVSRINSSAVAVTLTAISPAGTNITSITFTGDASGSMSSPTIGTTKTLSTTSSPAHIIATASFEDGTRQVVLDTRV